MDLLNFQVKVLVRTIVDVFDERPNALAYLLVRESVLSVVEWWDLAIGRGRL